jgi:hypothetical protein
LLEKIEGEFSLWEKKVPTVWGKWGIAPASIVKEVVLERANIVFSPVFGDAYLVGQVGTCWST